MDSQTPKAPEGATFDGASRERVTPDDLWSRWLWQGRDGGDSDYRLRVQQDLDRFRTRVLDLAQLSPGMTFADIGCGDGLLTFGAFDRVGPSLSAILVDISPPLIESVRAQAQQRGILGQFAFHLTSADTLAPIASQSADVAMTRATLAYVTDKRTALREMHRILKPGGRIALAEPIFQDDAMELIALRTSLQNLSGRADIDFLRLLCKFRSFQYPDSQEALARNPMTCCNERDLLRLTLEAGFREVHLELHIDHRVSLIDRWEVFLDVAPHPLCPTSGEILREHFTPSERQVLQNVLKNAVENGKMFSTDRIAYLTARK